LREKDAKGYTHSTQKSTTQASVTHTHVSHTPQTQPAPQN